MCQAIVKPAGVKIVRRTMAKAWAQNPDGGGYAYLDEDQHVWYQKGFRDFSQFWRAYREHSDGDVLIHFRLATHGARSQANTHPFVIGPDLVMAHNGILSDYTPTGKDDRSDTRIFVDRVLGPAMVAAKNSTEFLSPALVLLLKELIGYNRLVFLSNKGFTIVNEHQGEWANGVWWSAGDPDTYRSYVSLGEGMADWGYDHESGAWTAKNDERIIPYKGSNLYQQWREGERKRLDDTTHHVRQPVEKELCIACNERKQYKDGLCFTCDYDIAKMLKENGVEAGTEDINSDVAIQQRLADIEEAPVEGSPTVQQMAQMPSLTVFDEKGVPVDKINKLDVWMEAQDDLNRQALQAARAELVSQQLRELAEARDEMNQRVSDAEELALGEPSSQYADNLTDGVLGGT